MQFDQVYEARAVIPWLSLRRNCTCPDSKSAVRPFCVIKKQQAPLTLLEGWKKLNANNLDACEPTKERVRACEPPSACPMLAFHCSVYGSRRGGRKPQPT